MQNVVRMTPNIQPIRGVSCDKEIGRWTIRLNGFFLIDFWREAPARRLAMRIEKAIRDAS